jgi:hypothetical protein
VTSPRLQAEIDALTAVPMPAVVPGITDLIKPQSTAA